MEKKTIYCDCCGRDLDDVNTGKRSGRGVIALKYQFKGDWYLDTFGSVCQEVIGDICCECMDEMIKTIKEKFPKVKMSKVN